MANEVLAAPSDNPAERFAELTRGFLHAYVGASNRHKVLVNDLDNLPVDRRRKVVRVERELIDIVSDVLAAIGPHYGTSRAERRASTMLYFGMINWTHTWYGVDGPLSVDALTDRVIAIFLGRHAPIGEGQVST